MKNLKLFVIAIITMFVVVVGVSAAEMPAYATNDGTCTVDNIADLEAAISAKWEKTKKNGEVVEVSCTDIVIKKGSNITFDRDLTFNGDGNLEANEGNVVLDLNGHTITFANDIYFEISDTANVTLKNGSLVQTSNGMSIIDLSQGATLKTSALTINVNGKEVFEEGEHYVPYAFDVYGLSNTEQATLVVSADTVVNVPHGNGLLLADHVNVKLDGTWNTYGSLVVDDGATKTTNVTFVGGTYTTEYGISIPIKKGNWVFNGGTFISNNVAVYVNNVTNGSTQTVKINNGVFETKNNGSKPLMADTLKNFVYGGIFKAPIISDELNSDYVANDPSVTKVVENRVTYVGRESTIGIKESANGKVESSKTSAVTGQEVTLTVTPDEGYVLGALTVTYGEGNKLEVTANEDGTYTFAMPANYVMVSAEFVKTYKVEVATNITNGKVTVNNPIAKEGDTVTVTVTPDEGYEVSKVFVNGTEIKVNEDGTYSFAMPASDVTVSAEFEKVQINNPEAGGHETETGIVVEDNKGTKEVTLSENTNDVLKESLKNTKDKELQEFLASNNVTVHLESNKVAKENVAAEVVEKFESVVKGATVAEYFDLDILVTAEGVDEVHYLKELSKPITLTVDLPKLPEVAKGYTRTYYILREHNGVYEKLNATLTKDGKLSFATDKFSKYAIAYEDVKNPDTLDSIVSIVTLAISSIGTAGYSIKKFIRK